MLDDKFYLRKCVEVSENSIKNGNTPFGAVLVDKDGNILLEQENIELTTHSCTGHAETSLVAEASKHYSKEFLKDCTLYSTFEPCAMCSGAIYWSNVGRVVYGLSEEKLLELTGDNPVNPTMSLPCRVVLGSGQKDIEVVGPFDDKVLEDEILKVHKNYWK